MVLSGKKKHFTLFFQKAVPSRLKRPFASTIKQWGRCGIRFTEKLESLPNAHKLLRFNPKNVALPQLEFPQQKDIIFPHTVRLVSNIPKRVPFSILKYICRTLNNKVSKRRILCSEPAYMALAGVEEGSWSLSVSVQGSTIYVDTDLDIEDEFHASARAFLTKRFDTRYPQTAQLVS